MNETADSDRELLHRLRKLLESGDIDTIAKSDWKFSTIKDFPRTRLSMHHLTMIFALGSRTIMPSVHHTETNIKIS